MKLDLGPTRVLSCFIGSPKHPSILLTTLTLLTLFFAYPSLAEMTSLWASSDHRFFVYFTAPNMVGLVVGLEHSRGILLFSC